MERVKFVLSKRFLWLFPFAILGLLTGCYGRPKSQVNSALVYRAAGLQPGQPAVVAFGALWCHPCREEIDSLNQASREFSGVIQFKGFLVEGEEKGSAVQQGDLPRFTSFTGEKPEYTARTDQNWQLFDSLHTPQGHSLPTLVVFDQSGQVAQVIQQSLDYESQLRPLLVALTRGETKAPVDQAPKPPPQMPGQQQLTDLIANWLVRKDVVAHPELVKNVTQSWRAGIKKFGFPDAEMPFESGDMTFASDGNLNTPQSASWMSDTQVSVCTLNIVFHPDGTTSTSFGNCRQK